MLQPPAAVGVGVTMLHLASQSLIALGCRACRALGETRWLLVRILVVAQRRRGYTHELKDGSLTLLDLATILPQLNSEPK